MRSSLVLALAAVGLGSVALASDPLTSTTSPLLSGPARYEYAVRCVFKGSETAVTANYKLKCQELGSEVKVCPPLEYEACRMQVVTEMGQQGWRFIDTTGERGLGPSPSVTFEREVTGLP